MQKERTWLKRKQVYKQIISVVYVLKNMRRKKNGFSVHAPVGHTEIVLLILIAQDANGLPRMCPYCLV